MKRCVRLASCVVFLGAGVLAGCERSPSKPKPDTVVVTLEPADVSAGDGTTWAHALVTDNRVPLHGFLVQFQTALVAASGANPTYAAMTAETDVNGIATVNLTGLQVAGAGSVTGTAMKKDGTTPYLDSEDLPVAGSASLRVHPSLAVSLDASLSVNSIDLDAQDSLEVSWIVRDAQGNLTADPVEIVTDHPGATVLGSTVANLGATGNWSVSVSVVGRPDVSDTENFSVTPAAGAIIDTILSNATTDAYADPALHPPVLVGFQVIDGTGNDVTAAEAANVICTISGLSGGAVQANLQIFPLVVKGTFPVTCSLLDALGGLVDADAETLTVVDLTPPSVVITSPAANTHFPSGATIDVVVNSQDVVGSTQVTAQLAGLGGIDTLSQLVTGDAVLARNVTLTFPLQAANANFFGGTQNVFATALDGSGNVANAPAIPVIIDPFDLMPNPGIAFALVREDSQLNFPLGITVDPNSGAAPVLFVADAGGVGVIWRINYNRAAGTSTMVAASTGWVTAGVEFNAGGTQLFAPSADQVRVFDHAGGILTVNRTITVPGASDLIHSVFGPVSPTACPVGPCLYVTDGNAQAVWVIDTSTDASALFANNVTARNGGGPAMDRVEGIAFDPVTQSLFVSDGGFLFGGGNDVVYELRPDGADAGAITDSLQVLMNTGRPEGPDPDRPFGVAYRGLGGTGLYANRVFTANVNNDEVYEAIRDGGDAGFFSDDWNRFLRGNGRPAVDMEFQPGTDRMYMLFFGGNGMDSHVVELSGF